MAKIIWRPENKNGGQLTGDGEQKSTVPIRRDAKASKDDKFEVKHDGAWFAAEVSFRDGITLIHYNGFDNEDDIEWNGEEIQSLKPNIDDHIRVVSEQLQDAECDIVSVNKIVCAFKKARPTKRQEGWYDALVTEVTTRPHTSGDEGKVCTCSFTVIWQDGPEKGRFERNLTCGDICVLSNKDVATHPLIADILRHVSRRGTDEGRAAAEEEEGPRCSAQKVRKRKRKIDSDDDTDDYIPSLDEQKEASLDEQTDFRRLKRLKSKVNNLTEVKTDVVADQDPRKPSKLAGQVNNHSASTSLDRGIPDVPLPSHLAEQKGANESVGLSAATSCKGRMRGSLSSIPDVLRENRFEKCFVAPFVTSSEGPLQRETSDTPTADPFREQILRSKSVTSSKGPLQREDSSTPTANAFREQSLGSKSSTGPRETDSKRQVQPERSSTGPRDTDSKRQVQQETSSTGPRGTDCKAHVQQENCFTGPPETGCKHQVPQENVVFSNADALQEQRARAKVFVDLTEEDAECKVEVKEDNHAKADCTSEGYIQQKLPETIASAREAQRSKEVRITVNFNIQVEPGGSLSKSFAGAKVTSYPSNCEEPVASAGKSWAEPGPKASEAKGETLTNSRHIFPAGAKDEEFLGSSVKKEKVWDRNPEEPLGSVGECVKGPLSGGEESFGGPNKSPSAQPHSEENYMSGMRSNSVRSGKEELVDSKPHATLGFDARNAICLSDEEEDCVISRSTPPTSSRGFAEASPRLDPIIDQQEGHLQDRARRWRSTFVKNALAKPGCVLLIDNLQVDVRQADLQEMLLKFCDTRKIQSVRIPPPYLQMNRAVGYVVFVDKEAADAAARDLNSCLIVSDRGRPWIVNRPGQEEASLRNTSILTGDVEDRNGGFSAGGFKVLTRKQYAEYNAAKKKQRVFEEHRKQARVMFQRHAREENKLDANPDLSLDHISDHVRGIENFKFTKGGSDS